MIAERGRDEVHEKATDIDDNQQADQLSQPVIRGYMCRIHRVEEEVVRVIQNYIHDDYN